MNLQENLSISQIEKDLSSTNNSSYNLNESTFVNEFNEFWDNKQGKVDCFACKNCLSIPIITFIGNLLQIVCSCGINEQLTIEDVYENFLFNRNNINYDDIFRCPKHRGKKKRKKYHYYCKKCKQNQCKYCICSDSSHNKNNNIYKFDQNEKETQDLIVELKKKLDDDQKINNKLREIFEIIFDNFSNNPYHYSSFDNIKTIKNYLMKSNKAIKDNDK